VIQNFRCGVVVRVGSGVDGRPRTAAAEVKGQQPRTASNARPQLSPRCAAGSDAVRAGPVGPQAVQDRHTSARQELHPHAQPIAGGNPEDAAARVPPATGLADRNAVPEDGSLRTRNTIHYSFITDAQWRIQKC